jgi:RNA polymerase-binding transcription factor
MLGFQAPRSSAGPNLSLRYNEMPRKITTPPPSRPTKASAVKSPAKTTPSERRGSAKAAGQGVAASTKPPAKKTAPAKKSAPVKKVPAKRVPVVKKAPAVAAKAPAPKKALPAKKGAPAFPVAPPVKKAARVAKAPSVAKAQSGPKAGPPSKASPASKGLAPVGKAKAAAPVAKARPKEQSPAFLSHQRELLLAERMSYVESAEALKAQADSLALEHEPGDVQFDEEGGEGGTANVDREMDLHLSAQASATVEEIDRALAKIQDGTYGLCEHCGDPIPEPRLQALPHASLCVSCKSGGLSSRR